MGGRRGSEGLAWFFLGEGMGSGRTLVLGDRRRRREQSDLQRNGRRKGEKSRIVKSLVLVLVLLIVMVILGRLSVSICPSATSFESICCFSRGAFFRGV